MLTVISTHELALSASSQKSLWKCFLAGGTHHSRMAGTLPFIIRKCEQGKVPYTLNAVPGAGYSIAPYEHLKVAAFTPTLVVATQESKDQRAEAIERIYRALKGKPLMKQIVALTYRLSASEIEAIAKQEEENDG